MSLRQPDLQAELRYPSRGGGSGAAMGSAFAHIAIDAGMVQEAGGDAVKGSPGAVLRRFDIHVVQVGDEELAFCPLLRGSRQGLVDPKGEQRWGERIPLFDALSLVNVQHPPLVVAPKVGGLLPVPEADEWNERGEFRDCVLFFEDGGP